MLRVAHFPNSLIVLAREPFKINDSPWEEGKRNDALARIAIVLAAWEGRG